MKILIINGPNLNLLGKREPKIYGKNSLKDLIIYTQKNIENKKIKLEWFQSNLEGEIINKLQEALTNKIDGIIINPGGYAHSSVAIHDAMKILRIPIVEVHLSQIYQREDFRHCMLTAKAATAVMTGLGPESYLSAINAMEKILKRKLK
jgi:3-dehydroquinate dehydratase-2